MKPLLVTTLATGADEGAAVAQTLQQLAGAAGGAQVRGGLLFASGDYSAQALRAGLGRRLRETPFLGTSGASSLATEKGAADGRALAGLWLVGEGFSFATACAGGAESGAQAVDAALARGGMARFKARLAVAHLAGGPGRRPELLGEQLGRARAVLGATGAAVWSNDELIEDGVGVALCDWPWQLGAALGSVFAPTASRGRVTRARPGELGEIDRQEARGRYARWLGEADGPDLFLRAAHLPLGFVRGLRRGEPSFALARPGGAGDGRGIAVKVEVKEGDEVVLMAASAQMLEGQAAKAVERARAHAGFPPAALLGGLVLMELPPTVDKGAVTRELAAALGPRPFVLVFAGTQLGSLAPRRLELSDLSANALLLSDEPDLSEGG